MRVHACPFVANAFQHRTPLRSRAGRNSSQLPSEIVVQAASAENPSKTLTWSDQIQFLRDKGFVVTENPDGTLAAKKPKPTV